MNLAEVFVQISGQPAPLYRTLDAVHRRLIGFAGRAGAGVAGGIGRGLAANAAMLLGGAELAATALGGGLVAGFVKASQGASDLAEAVNKVDVVFGNSAKVVKATADGMADAFGMPKRVVLEAASNIGLIAKGAGYAQDKAAGLGSEMAKLAADAASFYNVPLGVALEKIRSGLVGEAEPLRQFGVLLSEDAVKQEALRLGISKTAKELTESQKVQARVSLIQKGLADATGDLERTQSGAANQTRQFWGQLENLRDTIGAELLPYFSQLVTASNRFIADFARGFGEAKDRIAEFKAKVDEVLFVAQNFGTVWDVAALDVQIGVAKMIGYLDNVQGGWDRLREYIAKNPLKAAADIAETLGAAANDVMMGPIKMAAGAAGIPFVNPNDLAPKGARAPKISELLGDMDPGETDAMKAIKKDRDRLLAKLTEKRSAELEAAGGKAAPAAAVKQRPVDAAVAKPVKERKADFLDLASFAKKLQEGVFGKDAGKETAKWTEMTAKGVQALVQGQKDKKPNPGFAV